MNNRKNGNAGVSGEKIVIFTRYPVPGKTKTRLMAALGPAGAADLHRRMAEFTLRQVLELAQKRPLAVEIRFEGGDLKRMKEWLGENISYRAQGPGDLGERMSGAFRENFEANTRKVAIIGADCPGLTPSIMAKALDSLDDAELCLGPAKDGGYYLIALKTMLPELFMGMPWGGGQVLQKTLELARKAGVTYTLLDELEDIDRPEDLHLWKEPA